MARPKTTKYDDETLDAPQSTSPGDAPADTYDPTQRVVSAQSDKGAAAESGHQTVNAVVEVDPIPEPEAPADGGRTETVIVYDNDGNAVEVERNYDTGETTVPEPDPEG